MIFKFFILIFFITIIKCYEKFGMNKPHMLFHVSSREKVNLNFGWGYWQDNGTAMKKLRMKYQNIQNQLYALIEQHDGQTHMKETIIDSNYSINTTIKYQNINRDLWQSKIDMNHSPNNTLINSYLFFSIENCQYKTVDKIGYSSDKLITVEENEKFIILTVTTKGIPTDKIYIKSANKLKLFGLSGNISQTWNIQAYAQQYKNMMQLIKYPDTIRTDQKNLKKWQDRQIQEIKKNIWDKNYIVVFIRSEFVTKQSFHVQWRSITNNQYYYTPFNEQRFQQKSNNLYKLYSQNPKQQLLKHTLFNLLGGIAYYFGPLYAQNSLVQHQETYTYSTTPSRLIFPRSFLWDDGFHMMVLVNKFPNKVLEFLEQWINKIDLFGWIAREQIRGYQVSAMMPQLKFVYQDSFQANPPTLMLPILYMIKHEPQNPNLRKLLKKNMWKIQKWFRYLKTTQSHYDLTEVQQINQQIKFRWRCKDECKNGNFMGSGLDDYPRSDHGKLSKQHVDLISWLYFFAEALQSISTYLNQTKGIKYYKSLKITYNQTLHREYLDPSDHLFKDVSVPDTHFINEFVTHLGYINLFPFMMGMIYQKSEAFSAILNIITDKNILWSQYGIRSLSINDSLYSTGDNYWRGAVWIPINYLILRACKLYYPDSTVKLYEQLRENIINVIQKNYNETGYLYENYHLGKGNRGYPFYGWSSLVSAIILQTY